MVIKRQEMTKIASALIVACICFYATSVSALTINYTCANLNDGGIAASCVADTWTFAAESNGLYNLGSGITLPSGDYLVTFTVTDPAGTGAWGWIGNVSDVHTQPLTGSESSYPITIDASADSANSIFFAEEGSFEGVLSEVSITSVDPEPEPSGPFNATSAQSIMTSGMTDSGIMIGAFIASVVAGLVALLGLGYGFRRLRMYITGKKF